ncbi:hypothetical protein D3C71_234770 [compost metagenome]
MNQNDLKLLLECLNWIQDVNCDIIDEEVIPGVTVEQFELLKNNVQFELLKGRM